MIRLGDCLDVMQSMDADSVDMVLTDPPYMTTNLKLDKDGWDEQATYEQIKRIMKPNGWFFLFGTVEMSAAALQVFKFKFEYVWIKTKPVMGRAGTIAPLKQHERIFAFIRPDLAKMSDLYFDRVALRTRAEPYSDSGKRSKDTEWSKAQYPGRRGTSIIERSWRHGTSIIYARNKDVFDKNERTDHPTQKPLDVLRYLIRGYCPPGGLVLDPFAGSGSTACAAVLEGRRYETVEMNPAYYTDAKKRIKKYESVKSKSRQMAS